MSLSAWLAFLVASILISVSPGPGAAASMSAGLAQGYRAALKLIAGLQLALLIQLGVVFAGLGALLAASETAFALLRLAGAGYLVWLGVQKWRSAASGLAAVPAAGRSLVLQGLLVNLGNPKAIVFMGALLPQFIDPDRSQWTQMAVMGATTCGIDIVAMSGYALLASSLRPWLSSPQRMAAQNRVFGGIFVLAGGALAISGQRH
jgi:homoserine/homoserine lactone efflux protein